MKTDAEKGATPSDSPAEKFFWALTGHPIKVLLGCLLLIAVAAGFAATKSTRDTRAEAFIAPDNPVLIYRDKVKEIFGLYEPIVVAVVNTGPEGVFNPESLALVHWFSEELTNIPGIDPDRITSLATEKDIYGTEDGMVVEPFFEYPPETQAEAATIRENVMDFPHYLGSLVARDGSATLIVAELLSENDAESVYAAVVELAERAPISAGEEVHVAGEGAVSGFLGTYIDRDASRLNPLAGLMITLILLIAYRTLRGVVLPNLVVGGAVIVALGSMAAAGVPFYVITNALPVLLIAIGVADAIHILSQYYEELAKDPNAEQRVLVVRAMKEMWRPVAFTTFTDVAGFAGLSIASLMPPMRAFGVFASVGVAGALLFSVLMMPAALVLLKPKQSPAFRNLVNPDGSLTGDVFSKAMARAGAVVIAHAGVVTLVAAGIAIAGLVGALQLVVNEERIENFRHSEPIYQADKAINERLDGTAFLDIVIETPEVEDLFKPENLARIETLQDYVLSLPHVNGATSIVDYLKQMNRAMNEDRKDAYVLPQDANLVAQYFLLYSASADPMDFEEEIDYDYRLANIRATMDSGQYQVFKPVVLELERYIEEEFNNSEISAHLAGRVYLDYHWLKDLASSHFKGVALALIGVWLMASLSFRSLVAGLFATAPVCMALLAIYAVMGSLNVWLGVGTSMFAAISIGISVDFAIHTLDKMIDLVRKQGKSIEEAFEILYPSTGRALLFNFTAVLFGFGVLLTSEVPPLNRFGALVGVAVTFSFIGSLTVLPAMLKLIRPKFLTPEKAPRTAGTPVSLNVPKEIK